MNFFDDLKSAKSFYAVTPTSDGGFVIASIDESREGRQHFVRLATEAIERAHGEGYEVVLEHESSRDSLGLDKVVFAKLSG